MRKVRHVRSRWDQAGVCSAGATIHEDQKNKRTGTLENGSADPGRPPWFIPDKHRGRPLARHEWNPQSQPASVQPQEPFCPSYPVHTIATVTHDASGLAASEAHEGRGAGSVVSFKLAEAGTAKRSMEAIPIRMSRG